MHTLLINQAVCIAGPTASGKSAFAVKLARQHDGEIINADALQVYSDLRVLSARPSEAEMEGIPHHLFGHVNASVRYNTGAWLRDVVPIIVDVLARGKMPIITGGTGLYFKALTHGLAQIPQPSADGRGQANALLRQGVNVLRAAAHSLDPVATVRVLGDDPQRLLRIVEVALGTDKPLSAWQANTRPVIPKPYWRGLVLRPNREGLYAKINARFDGMANSGGYDEAKALHARGLDPMLPAMKAIGLRELIAIHTGQLSETEGLETAKRETRRFAKRQYTWFRGQASDWETAEADDECETFAQALGMIAL